MSPCLFFALAGLLASFTAAIELPAASFAALLLFVLLLRAPRQTLLWAVPAALIPVAGFFATNYAAIGQLRPAYSEFGGPWYEYEGSHWKPDPVKPKRGIDWAKLKESRVAYAFNFLIGHHGLFSLTPMFLLSLAGVVWTLRRGMMPRAGPEPPADQPSLLQATLHKLRSEPFLLAAMTAILSVVVIGYLLWKSDNYGGWTSGPRWLFWLTPFWLLTMLPVVGQLAARRWGRVLALALLMVSVVSASFTSWNPWRHPWLYQFLDSLGLVPY